MIKRLARLSLSAFLLMQLCPPTASAESVIPAAMSFAPEVPKPITRKTPAIVRVDLETVELEGLLMKGVGGEARFTFWTYNGRVPGPFIRVRVGDTLELHLKNPKTSTMPHNVDFHAATGPGGGGAISLTNPGAERVARLKMLYPGLYVYHCSAPPVSTHIALGMYGLILVEPEAGLPAVDREYYVMQGEIYTKGEIGDEGLQVYDIEKALLEHPTYVVFNGRVGALKDEGILKSKTNEKVRLFFGNGGPNLVSSFHVIGTIFQNVYHEGSLTSAPLTNVQTTLVPAGGSTVVDFATPVPGNYTLVDHSIFRIEKGAVGVLRAEGPERKDIYDSIK